jgi:hypothetical protein
MSDRLSRGNRRKSALSINFTAEDQDDQTDEQDNEAEVQSQPEEDQDQTSEDDYRAGTVEDQPRRRRGRPPGILDLT